MKFFTYLDRIGKKFDKWWKGVPTQYRPFVSNSLNYLITGTLFSFCIYYFFLIQNPWVKYIFLIPVTAICLALFEHYYKFFRNNYQN